jgi:hypothetical protein
MVLIGVTIGSPFIYPAGFFATVERHPDAVYRFVIKRNPTSRRRGAEVNAE